MNNAYDIVMSNRKELVECLIAQMEKGYAATRAAWNKSGTRPYNPVSDAVYKGGNRLRLMIAAAENDYKDSRWLTFKQAEEKHYKIKPGSKGVLLEKWIFHKDVPKLDENGKPVLDTNGKPETERKILEKPVVNYFRVFNGEQVTGLPELEHKEITEDIFTNMADRFERSSLCPINYEYQDRAYYSVTEDKIHLPPKVTFKNNEARLSVLLHEMAHSTGHPDRLNRSIRNKFGSPDYAREELNAELSSAFLESELGITMEPDSEMIKDHSNYLKSWISVLREDPNELFRACANAEKITEFLMERYESELSIEERYTETMEMLNYHQIEVDKDSIATVGFQHNTDSERYFLSDGWEGIKDFAERAETIAKDICEHGFMPTSTLIDNINWLSLNCPSGKNYTIKQLAELHKTNPDYFKENPRNQKCFEQIIKECQEQEMENQIGAAKEAGSFLKQEMLMEQSLIMGT